MGCRKQRWSSTEVLLSVLCLILLAVCVGLIVVSWLALQADQDQGEPNGIVFNGRMVITRGAVFTEELRNRSSLQFKSLAFETEHLISEAYGRGSLCNDFKACRVLHFSNGSVVVNFDLQFRYSVEVEIVEQQLVAGLQNTGDLVVDRNSIQVTVKEDLTTTQPTVPPHLSTKPPSVDCGGPFDLWEPNSTFSSPNYPSSYGNKAFCLWTLHARDGWNIQLHFLDFDVEPIDDVVEVRDGAGPASELLGVFTGFDATIPDVISTANQITVIFSTDISGHGRGFHANFTSGLALGRPKPCATGFYLCQSGECIFNTSVCDGQPDCVDSSDEADCVHLVSVNGTSVRRLQLQVQTRWYTTCAENWNAQFTHFMCRYLGYRSGSAVFIAAEEKYSPFTTVSVAANGSLDLTPSEKCTSEKVISLQCDNRPCGVRMVSQEMRRGGLAEQRMGEDESEESATGRVVGGAESPKGAWPWMVSLHWRGRHVCGATLIDSQWLVTAAHCIYGKNIHLSNWVAVLGLHSQANVGVLPSQTRKVDRVIMNKHYNKQTKDADIAMMHLQTNVTFTEYIQPICLPRSDQQFEAGRKCFIAGWGREAEQGAVSNVLQQATLPLLSQSECQKLLPEYNITARMLCAGYPEGGVDSCQGDSGGPLMCEMDGHWVQVGVVSFGKGCGRPLLPGVYAMVSQFTDWIVLTRRSQ
ncbi:enteropeptidase [Esox lucius]|uniref:enteropeptidase n=1 Tax=Esox lucius TaxID=8010 RepID=UPI001476DA20|nr:enteropeptidase [Esox lucius]